MYRPHAEARVCGLPTNSVTKRTSLHLWDVGIQQPNERACLTWTPTAPRSTVILLSSPLEKESPTLRRGVVAVHSGAKSPLVATSLEPLAILFVHCAFRPEGLQKPLLRDLLPDQNGPAPSFLDAGGEPFSRYLFVSANVQRVGGSAVQALPLFLKP